MDTHAYLRRIDYQGSLDPSAATLRDLQLAHLLAVPFENLDIALGRPIRLSSAALFDKIVTRRRGGFCYELNGLFAWLLRELGFEVAMLSAGVARAAGGFGPDFDHLALRVWLPGAPLDPRDEARPSWLADVGFGDSFREPLRFVEGLEQEQDGRAYRLDRSGEHYTLLQRDQQGWEPQYRFTLQPHAHAEFADMCHYHQTAPESSFTQRRVCTLALPDGRITLSEHALIRTTHRERSERQLQGEQERPALLWEHFGIDLSLHPAE